MVLQAAASINTSAIPARAIVRLRFHAVLSVTLRTASPRIAAS
jgi:hypothetical protein